MSFGLVNTEILKGDVSICDVRGMRESKYLTMASADFPPVYSTVFSLLILNLLIPVHPAHARAHNLIRTDKELSV